MLTSPFLGATCRFLGDTARDTIGGATVRGAPTNIHVSSAPLVLTQPLIVSAQEPLARKEAPSPMARLPPMVPYLSALPTPVQPRPLAQLLDGYKPTITEYLFDGFINNSLWVLVELSLVYVRTIC